MPAYKKCVLRRRGESGGLIKLVDIAPEEKGAMEFIEQCHDQVKISIAHTCSDYDTAREALEKGVIFMSAGANVIRFIPPLIIEKSDVDKMIAILDSVLDD